MNQKKSKRKINKENSDGIFTKQENIVFWRSKLNSVKN